MIEGHIGVKTVVAYPKRSTAVFWNRLDVVVTAAGAEHVRADGGGRTGVAPKAHPDGNHGDNKRSML